MSQIFAYRIVHNNDANEFPRQYLEARQSSGKFIIVCMYVYFVCICIYIHIQYACCVRLIFAATHTYAHTYIFYYNGMGTIL